MVKQIYLKEPKIGKIYKFLRLLKKKGIKVSQAILFGSYARGRANSDSDIDVAIVSAKFGKDYVMEMMFLRRLAVKVDSHLEPVPLSPEDLEDKYSTLIQQIKQYGRLLM